MARDSRPLAARVGPASPTAVDRAPPGPAWLGAIALLGALTLTACDDGGGSGAGDRGLQDASADAGEPDAAPRDAALVQAASPGVTAGGATVETGRYRLRVSVGGPSPTQVTSSERLQARIGVALPLPDTEERPR